MPTWSEFSLHSVQAAIFTPDHQSFNAGRSLAIVLAHFPDLFTGPMQVLPLPAQMPGEIPHVSLQSADEQWQLKMAPARSDCFWMKVDAQPELDLKTAANQCAKVIQLYAADSGVGIGRLAFVVNRVCPNDNPAKTLVERFCTPECQREPLNRSQSFEIHNHKVYTLEHAGISLTVNSWVRCKTAQIASTNQPIILVEQDLNTSEEDAATRRFTAAETAAFFECVIGETDSILHKYFPSQANQ